MKLKILIKSRYLGNSGAIAALSMLVVEADTLEEARDIITTVEQTETDFAYIINEKAWRAQYPLRNKELK